LYKNATVAQVTYPAQVSSSSQFILNFLQQNEKNIFGKFVPVISNMLMKPQFVLQKIFILPHICAIISYI